MSVSTVLLALALGAAAGVFAGMFGVGGGILFVPALVALGLGQIEAQATSLLAILPTAAAGAWSQHRYGNLRIRPAAIVGVASVVGVVVGGLIAVTLAKDHLRTLFALFLLVVAAQLAWRAHRSSSRYPEPP